MVPFVECKWRQLVEFVTTVAGDLYRAELTCALGEGHEGEDHWDPRGFYWRPHQPPPVVIGTADGPEPKRAPSGAART